MEKSLACENIGAVVERRLILGTVCSTWRKKTRRRMASGRRRKTRETEGNGCQQLSSEAWMRWAWDGGFSTSTGAPNGTPRTSWRSPTRYLLKSPAALSSTWPTLSRTASVTAAAWSWMQISLVRPVPVTIWRAITAKMATGALSRSGRPGSAPSPCRTRKWVPSWSVSPFLRGIKKKVHPKVPHLLGRTRLPHLHR